MIKRLNLLLNPAQAELAQACIDKTHQKVRFVYARKIFKNIQNQKYLTNLLSALKKYFKSSSNVLKVKSLIMLHYLLRKALFKNEKLIIFAQKQLTEMKSKKTVTLQSSKTKISLQNQQKQYIQKNIIQFYVLYLLKFLAHSQSYCEAKLTTQSPLDMFEMAFEQKYSQALQTTAQTKMHSNKIKISEQNQLMSYINHGFEIINLINYILMSQQSFNKMGRYYIEHDQILNLFVMYLDDMTVYNDFIKKLAKFLTKKISLLKQQQVKHCFLFLTQSQKTSDRLYQFYYNRYYYVKVKKLINMPTFLTIQNEDFQRVIKQIKRVDKELFLTVKQSKYSEQYKMNKTMMSISTQPNLTQQNRHKSKRLNQTMRTQPNLEKVGYLNKTIQNLKIHTKSSAQIEENITKHRLRGVHLMGRKIFKRIQQNQQNIRSKNQNFQSIVQITLLVKYFDQINKYHF